MGERGLTKADLEAFAYLSSLLPHVDLVATPIEEHMWDSFYVMAFGGNEICRARGTRAALTMDCMPDGRFTVLWEGDDQPSIDAIMDMVADYGEAPQAVGHLILTGQHGVRLEREMPDHLEVMRVLRGILSRAGAGRQFERVAAPARDAFDALHVRTHDAGDLDRSVPEFEYWRRYWNMPAQSGPRH
jgi:hypothetical protein